jgi:hypothetical protein
VSVGKVYERKSSEMMYCAKRKKNSEGEEAQKGIGCFASLTANKAVRTLIKD